MAIHNLPLVVPVWMCSEEVRTAVWEWWQQALVDRQSLVETIEAARGRGLGTALAEVLPHLPEDYSEQLALLDAASPLIGDEVLDAARSAAEGGMSLQLTLMHPADANVGVQVTTWHQLGDVGPLHDVGPLKEISIHVGEAFTA